MIPYFKPTAIQLFGGLQLQPFGLLVGTAVLSSVWMLKRRAKEAGIPEKEVQDMTFWAVVPGFLMAHWWTVFLYHPDWIESRGWTIIFKFWEGLSSFGGFFGGFLGLFIYFRFILRKPWLKHAELAAQGMTLGWIFGRLGCSLVHDHPGIHTDFFMAVNYPDGPRHDLGFYEFLFTLLILFPTSLAMHWRKARTGMYLVTMVLMYAPVRFIFDFLRVEDRAEADMRYLGLTPAQYGCIAVFIVGVWLLMRLRGRPSSAGRNA